ncbi:MAG TPA: CPBP family intramembrane glutamic endopeptidase [Verrucomicrobiae bacterium]|nr:CPBP family intramembrane glutamic endopeptidase [Verrucomicrobiae bacterium]
MRPPRALLLYLAFVFIGAAFVSPWIFEAIRAAGFENVPFRRVVSRCLIVLALTGMWPLLRALGARSRAEIGLAKTDHWTTDIPAGVLIGWGMVALAAGICLAVGAAELDSKVSVVTRIPGALLTALVVALLEEVLFRGAILTALSKVWGASTALWASSALYAIVHFFSRAPDPTEVQWDSGFFILGGMLQGFLDFEQVIPGFFSLTLLGVILGLAYQKTGALFMSMGIHGGIVFGAKLFSAAANSAPGANVWLWGTEKLIDGWFSFFLMLAVTLAFTRWRSTRA